MEPKICPYLGLIDDPNTSTSFPYEGNACYRAKNPTPVALPHQRGYCLTDEHTACPGYINGWANGFPKSLQAYQPVWQRVLRSKWTYATLAVIVLVSLYFIFPQQISAMGKNLYTSVSGWFERPPAAVVTETATNTPTGEPTTETEAAAADTATQTLTYTSTNTVTVTPTYTLTLTPTETGTPTSTATPTMGITYVIPPTSTKKPPPEPTNPPPQPTNTPVPPPTNTPVPTPTRPD